jgi:hypothetical protein
MCTQSSFAKISLVIIEIPGSTRSKKLIQQLSRSEVFDLEIFEAIMFKKVMSNFAPNYLKQRLLYGRNLSDGEIGAAISHHLVQKVNCEKSEPIVVLEDDARIPNLNAFENTVKRFVESKKDSNSVLSLLPWDLSEKVIENKYRRQKFHRLIGHTPLTVGYVITSRAMKELSSANFDFAYLPDWPPARTKFFTPEVGVIDHGDPETYSYIDKSGRQKTARIKSIRRLNPMIFLRHRDEFRDFIEYFRALILPSFTWRIDKMIRRIASTKQHYS